MKKRTSIGLMVLLLASMFPQGGFTSKASAAAAHLVISQVYGGGGNSGSTYLYDFVELYNPTDSEVNLDGYAIQYASKASSFTALQTGTSASLTPLDGKVIKAHGFLLIQEANGKTSAPDLPVEADVTGVINLSATDGKVALTRTQTAISGSSDPAVVDFLGYGGANDFEGAPLSVLSNSKSAQRKAEDGSQSGPGKGAGLDTDNNSMDFVSASVLEPRNSETPAVAVTKSAQPLGQLIQFTNEGSLGIVTGEPSSVTAATYVSVYLNDPSNGSVPVTTAVYADANGEIGNLSFDNSLQANKVYITAKDADKTESSPVIIDLAVPSAPLNDGKLNYYLDTNGGGRIIGGAGAAAPNSKIYAYNGLSGGSRFTSTADGKDYVTADINGSFTFNFDGGADDVYISQLTSTVRGIQLEGPRSRVTKGNTEIITPIGSIHTNDSSGKSDKIDQIFTIQGVVLGSGGLTAANTFYVQDATGGIAVFGTVPAGITVAEGDLVTITGAIQFYNGLTEITPAKVVKNGTAPIPAPAQSTLLDLINYTKAEPLEGSLVQFTGKITNIPAMAGNGYNLTVSEPVTNKSITVRVTTGSGIDISTLKKDATYTITGIFSQYVSGTTYKSGYQVFPRYNADMVEIKELSVTHQPITQAYTHTDITFTAKADNADSVVVYYRTVEGAYQALPMTKADGSNYSAVLNSSFAAAGSFEYYIEAKMGSVTKQSGSADKPYKVTVVDDTFAPTFYEETPMAGAKIEDRQPVISVKYDEPSGLDASTLAVTLDGKAISATISGDTILINNDAELSIADHAVNLRVSDTKHNEGTYTWTFTVTPVFSGGNHYRGTTHNHTNISHDAAGTPEDALKAAEAHHYDFFAFSDHSHDIDAALSGQDTVDHKGSPERTGGADWQLTKDLAKKYTKNDDFVVFPAFEMTSTTWGHSNVFGTDNFIDRKQNSGQYQDLSKYYAWVLTYDDIVAQFNHPDMSANAFNNFTPYDSKVDKLFTMFEVGNGSGHYGYANSEAKFFKALDLGWHVAPTYGEDNHDGTWGQTNARTVIVADDLSQESLLQSMRNMRVYMSEDPNFTLDFLANGSYMGATVKGSTLNFSVTGKDDVAESKSMPEFSYLSNSYKSDDRVAKVEILSNGGKVLDSYSPMTKDFTWNPTVQVTGGQQWYVVKVTQMDGERVYSAPIWSQDVTTDVKVSGINVVGNSLVSGSPSTLEAGLTNLGSKDLTNLNVHFYVDEVNDSHLIQSVTVPSIQSKGTATARVTWANPLQGNHTIIAVLDAPPGDSPDDNQFRLDVHIKASLGMKVMIDASHKNENTTLDTSSYKDNLKSITEQLRQEGYTVAENNNAITESTLADVKVLMFTHPSIAVTDEEAGAIADFVRNGGSLLLTEKSNNSTNPAISNNLLEKIGSEIRVSNDGIFDTSPDGNFWSQPIGNNTYTVRLHPAPVRNYITDRSLTLEYYSGASLEKAGHLPLVDTDHVTVLVHGNETTFQDKVAGGGYVYDNSNDGVGGSAIPAIASEELGKGRIIVSGMNFVNDKQMDESYNAKGNNELGINAVNWLAHRDTQIDTIEKVRTEPEGTPAVIEGTVVTGSNIFFDAFYVQDATGGIMAFKEVPENSLIEGDTVRVYGETKTFENNQELEFGSFAMDVIKTGHTDPVQPRIMTTGAAKLDQNQGLLVQVKGKVVSQFDENSYVIDDGTGPILIFTDGYIAKQSGPVPSMATGDTLEAVGLIGKNTEGTRIRVRNTKELIKTESSTDPTDPTDPTTPTTPSTPDGSGSTSSGNQGQTGSSSDQNRYANLDNMKIQVKSEHGIDGLIYNKVTVDADSLNKAFLNHTQATLDVQNIALPVKIELPLEAFAPADGSRSDASLKIQNHDFFYDLPAKIIAAKALAAELGLDLKDLKLELVITKADEELSVKLNEAAKRQNVQLVSSGWQFSLAAVGNGKKKEIDTFGTNFVSRGIVVSSVLDPKTSTGVRYDEGSGELVFVPTYFNAAGNETTAAMKRNGNSIYAVVHSDASFGDIKGHWAQQDIQLLASKLIVKGQNANAFAPNAQVTRAEFAAMLVRSLGLSQAAGTDIHFKDVKASDWFYGAVATAADAKMINGFEDQSFRPSAPISREEMAVMIQRALAYTGHSSPVDPESILASFKDNGTISSWARSAVAELTASHIISGMSANLFVPKGVATRAQAVKMLKEALQSIQFIN
ncbi:Ig domain-containing protein group 2 domain-containing protein [Paenibacillus sp. HJL G12]|uniref:Ig domain-containing protein group 2 domain-containing protein n=2 Tax=Paenibacillus dendrobii TaxID=2691084 RepID=A0A7X3IHG5_9BACL|nr:Ig domain-containing protein group 2 domain-containing protein [Paenibacillus dendrobii]